MTDRSDHSIDAAPDAIVFRDADDAELGKRADASAQTGAARADAAIAAIDIDLPKTGEALTPRERSLTAELARANQRIAELEAELADAKSSARIDSLTGLYKREVMEDHISEFANRRGQHFAVMFIDVNKMKALNEECGFMFVNRVLAELGERLLATRRPGDDKVGRFAGDEFIVLVDLDGVETQERAEQIADGIAHRFAAETTFEFGGAQISTTVGYTLASGRTRDRDPEAVDSIIDRASEAMKQTKARSHANGTSEIGYIAPNYF